ncbi:sushi, von Willebrand factor type A, EGF and pentraxin domain-containing protein 1-like [Asterias amurensis]|uniref:sushi, von Willebrand factor type A, EGF and pentraxin domain-containing protein 1-like n=1 Tax=Asterias amurensis TaxID=7602 RepID=UPI003AB25F68
MAVGTRRMIAVASALHMATTLLWLSGLVQSQVYPDCPQTANIVETDRAAVLATSTRFLRNLEKFQNQQAEIVFVLDASGSVGRGYFGCEVQFVRHFSKLFSVSEENSRIAVVTYSSCDKVYTDIDYITDPVGKNKCTFLGNDLPAYVTYRDGGTCTVEGLRRAQGILAQSRHSAAKIVFLLTDGQSNDGGTPLNVATAMKNSNIDMFTVGLGTGISVAELDAIASTPTDDYRYLLDQLTDVESLANKLKGDERDMKSWDRNVSPHLCDTVCSQGQSCCDAQATCSCATQTGSYGCACQQGYKGDGKVGECDACPRGTYKEVYGNQDCTSCPDLSTTPGEGSVSLDACECLPGHEGTPKTNSSCTPIKCDQLTFGEASGVQVVPPNCGNHFGVECGLQCKQNYRAQHGTSADVRCLATGQWSAEPLRCTPIECEELPQPSNGQLSCDTADRSIGTVCNMECNEGYELKGSLQTQCELNDAEDGGQWSNTNGRCSAKKCPILLKDTNMRILPDTCENTAMVYNSLCSYECDEGFQVQGVKLRTCQADGQWSESTEKSRCVDIQPPVFTTCPDDISLPTDPRLSFATNPENWDKPEARDNDGEPDIEASPSATQERFPLDEETDITYTARDKAGLESTCTFSITVRDEESPKVINCSKDIEEQSSTRLSPVVWDEPVFTDNSREDLMVVTNRQSGSNFSWGLPEEVWYNAKDKAGNNVSCAFMVSVKQYKCPFYPSPQNGALVCETWLGGQFCRVACNENFDFNRDPEELYYCRTPPGGDTAEWGPTPTNLNPINFRMPWPECSEKRDPSVKVGLELNFFTGDCQANELEIKEDFIQKLKDFVMLPGLCMESMGCTVENVEVSCSQADPLAGRRRRRRQSNNVLSIKFTVKVDAPEQAVDQMQPQNNNQSSTTSDSLNSLSVIGNFIEAMDTIVSGGQLNITAGDGAPLTPTGPLNVVRPVQLLCELGEVLRNNSCIICPSGTFHDVEGGICRDCSVGYYQDMKGQLECQQCPLGTSTRRTTSTSLKDCKERCTKGTYSTSGLKTCKACPKGSYQPSTGSTSCQACPYGLTTWTEGAVHADECSGECPFGTYSSTGFSPCKPCPMGTYQPSFTQTLCIECPEGLYTHSQGAHDMAYCQVINECEDDTSNEGLCGPDGLCLDLPKGYQCICKLGFTGPDCQTNINDCDHDLCLNNGTCVDLVGEYRCDCASGFAGIHCQEDVNECESDPCLNRAVCIDGKNTYSCECAPGFTGESCEVNFFDCASDPCLNDGTCVDLAQNFTCCCRPGYRGRLCETLVDHCDSSPCMNNATCRGTFNSANCTCQQGFTGNKCEVDINECLTEQVMCRNGGTCQDLINGFKCKCYPGYSGTFCESVLLGDFDLTFPGASTSNYVMLKGTMPRLYAFTITFWMQTSDKSSAGTPLSYAAYNADGTLQDNALTLSDYNSLAIILNGKFIYTDVKLNSDANWHHVGVTWAGMDGQWAVYVDGVVKRIGSDFQTGSHIRASGALILGQEQDSYAGSFAQTQAFVGGLTQLNIWDYAMTQAEIQRVYASCTVPGNVLTWSQVASNVHGGIYISPTSSLCQAKTNCLSTTCNYNGVCTDLVDSFECHCNLGYSGTGCEQMATACSSGMCLNGGSCHSNGSSLNCSCATGYTGERCEFMSNPCHSMVCLNGGICESVEHQPKCNCPAGLKGRSCEYDIDECDGNNGGCAHECTNTVGSYYCQCSDGYALQSDSHSCNDVSYCTHEGRFHLADDMWNFECSMCHCEQGMAVCEVMECPELKCKENEQRFEAPGACCPECLPESKTCSVSTRGKYLTYDGNKFDNTGNCRYVLSQDCVGSQFSIEVQYEANKKKFYRRAVFLRLDCVEVEVNYDGMVKVTGVPVELPYTHAAPMNVLITRTNTSLDEDGITITTNRGVIIRWSKKNDIEVSAPKTFAGALCGLCGNMNGNRKDDRTTRQFLPSRSAMEFAHSWKVDGYKHCSVAKIRGKTRQKFGSISINNIPVCAGKSFFVLKDIRKKCSLLRQRSFQMCHSVVDPNRYFEWCMQDACSCHSNEPCYCEAISAYILECQRNKVAIKWSEDSACNIRCPQGMIYDNCGPACLATCLNPIVDTAECLTTACVPQCQCPAGTVFHENSCVLRKYCPVITSNDE